MSHLEGLDDLGQETSRWLRQADHDLLVAQTNRRNGYYSDCCFMTAQAVQKALNALLIQWGERSVVEWSIQDLIKRAASYDDGFQPLFDKASELDQYHLPTRYPEFLAEPAVPFESYTSEQAARALESAQEMLPLIKRKIQGRR